MLKKIAFAVLMFAAAPALADVKVAAVGPMTGSVASTGEQLRHGSEMAVADINAKGGVLGQKLNLEVADDVCDPKQAVAIASRLVAQGDVFVSGHYCSGSSIPASPIYAEEGVVQISPGSTNPQLTEQGFPTTFRVCGRDDQQGPVAAHYILDHYKGKKIAVLDDKTAYGKGIAAQVEQVLTQSGQAPALRESYNVGERDFNAIVSRMKQADIDVVYIGGVHAEAALIVRQMRGQGLKAQMIGGDDLVTSEFWSITGVAGEGTLITFGPDPRNNPEAADLVARFRKAGYEPEGYTLYAYAAFQAWAQAAEQAKSVKGDKVAAALHSGTFDTVMGKLSFDDKGDVKAPTYIIYQWTNGKLVEAK